jgi:hypothetical protein
MKQPKYEPGLINSRRDAMIALCLTGLVAALNVWAVAHSFESVAHSSQHRLPWLLDLRFILPKRPAVAVNVGIYAYLLYLGIVFYRMARGKERILVAGWFFGIFLGPLQILPSVSAAAIDYLQTAGMLIAFVAAVSILVEKFAADNARLDDQPTQRS